MQSVPPARKVFWQQMKTMRNVTMRVSDHNEVYGLVKVCLHIVVYWVVKACVHIVVCSSNIAKSL